jgi:hypothetical protein
MLQDLAAFAQQLLQQVLVTVCSAGVLVLATVAGTCWSRLLKFGAKARAHLFKFKINHGTVRVAVEITIGSARHERESLTGAKDSGRDS